MADRSLIAIIKAKQAQVARLHAELEQAQRLLAKVINQVAASSRPRAVQRGRWRRRSTKTLVHSPTAHEAAKVLRSAGGPLHATAIAKRMQRNGHKIALGTLVSTLSRWVNSRSVFYRVRPNVFGLIGMRQRTTRRRSTPS